MADVYYEYNVFICLFAMNRIYNEWYKSKGYNFDITSSPTYDQTFKEGRSTYESIIIIIGHKRKVPKALQRIYAIMITKADI